MAQQKKKPYSSPSHFWLLIAGTTDPKTVNYTDKSRDNGSYLQGIAKDLTNMEEMVNNDPDYTAVHNVIRDMKYAKKSMVIDRITKCARDCKQKGGSIVLVMVRQILETGAFLMALFHYRMFLKQ